MKRYISIILLSFGFALSFEGFASPYGAYFAGLNNHAHAANKHHQSMIIYDANQDRNIGMHGVNIGDDGFLVMANFNKFKAISSAVVESKDVKLLTTKDLAALDKNKNGVLAGDELANVYFAKYAAGDEKYLAIKNAKTLVKTIKLNDSKDEVKGHMVARAMLKDGGHISLYLY